MTRPLPILLTGCLLAVAWAEEPVHFAETSLEIAVEWHLNVQDPTPTDMLGLTQLVDLDLQYNYISDISPLADMTNLELLLLTFNPLNAQAYGSHLPTLVEQNPGMTLFHLPNMAPPTNVVASDGAFPDRVHITWEAVPNGPNYDANYAGTAVTFDHGEDPNCVLAGFVITRGQGRMAGAVRCEGSSPTLANCLIVGNRLGSFSGGVVYCTDSGAVLANCTIADNATSAVRHGIYLDDMAATLVNTIVWGDAPNVGILDIWATSKRSLLDATYCDIVGGWRGAGNIEADPLFVRRGHWVDPNDSSVIVGADTAGALWVLGDYHLQSQAGRWDPITRSWVQDGVTSPCIDMGDPSHPVGEEPIPDGGVINMGAYGGSTQASLGR